MEWCGEWVWVWGEDRLWGGSRLGGRWDWRSRFVLYYVLFPSLSPNISILDLYWPFTLFTLDEITSPGYRVGPATLALFRIVLLIIDLLHVASFGHYAWSP